MQCLKVDLKTELVHVYNELIYVHTHNFLKELIYDSRSLKNLTHLLNSGHQFNYLFKNEFLYTEMRHIIYIFNILGIEIKDIKTLLK